MTSLLPRARWCALLLLAVVTLNPLTLRAGDAPAAPDLAPDGITLVERVARFYQNLMAFSVAVTTEVSGPAGQFGARGDATVTLQRPNKLNAKLTLEAKDGVKSTRLVSDGTHLIMWTAASNRFVETPSPPNLQPLLAKFIPGLDFVVVADPKAKLLAGVSRLSVAAEEKVGDVLCQRLRLEHQGGTSDVLFETGPQPFLRGVELTDTKTGNHLRVRFDDWKTKLSLEPADLTFVAPEGAQKMDPAAAGAPEK